ncbi:MAG: AAA family ATPase, partial [Chloroflexi bacterium]|nr:AAA family ATPase [Chloroflexota bacterium]
MIKTLSVKNFKSLKDVELDCARINVLIGQPNSGKSNLLEALGMVSFAGYPFSNNPNTLRDVRDFVRVERTSNLFYDENLDQPLEIRCDSVELTLEFQNGSFQGQCKNPTGAVNFRGNRDSLNYTGGSRHAASFAAFKFYRFKPSIDFKRLDSQFLMPPNGDNLVSLLPSN